MRIDEHARERVFDDDVAWSAMEARDESADGAFLYGVMTTGVYCRPTCPSRRPLRRNVRFFATATEAEALGLRACRRCEPNGLGPRARRTELIVRICRAIESSEAAPTLAALAGEAGLSPFHIHRIFKAGTGITPKASGRFYASSNDRLGMTPGEYRDGGPDVDVRFAVGACSLGAVLVALSARGRCAIEFGDEPDELVRQLQDRFHAARLVGDDIEFAALVAHVVALVEEPSSGSDLPLDVWGTAFQERVWRALREVPAGSTVTEMEV